MSSSSSLKDEDFIKQICGTIKSLGEIHIDNLEDAGVCQVLLNILKLCKVNERMELLGKLC
jgi:hypothetical protein